MLTVFQYSLFMLLLAFSMFGWGRLIRLGAPWNQDVVMTIVMGMGISLFAGGVLNALHLGYGWVLNAYLAVGVVLALFSLRHPAGRLRTKRPRLKLPRAELSIAIAVFLALLIVLTNTVMIPEAYNYHDDYQKYFVQPVKMLATGSAFGSPLSMVGKDVFGGQGLFQAFFVYNLGLESINVFDSTFCLLLCVALLLEQGVKRGVFWFSLLSASLLVLIHPQYVNISSLYSSSLFMLAIILLSGELVVGEKPTGKGVLLFSVSLGLLYASLVSLKTTSSLFPAFHFMLFIIAVTLATRKPGVGAVIGLSATAAGVVFILPWTITILANLSSLSGGTGGVMGDALALDSANPAALFSRTAEFYGGSAFQYSMVVSLCLAAAIGALILLRGEKTSLTRQVLGAATVAGGLALFLIYAAITNLMAPQIHSFASSLRYAVPYIVGMAPGVLLLSFQLNKAKRGSLLGIPLAVLTAAAAIQFIPQADARIRQAAECGSTLAFSKSACKPDYRRYNDTVLRDGDLPESMQGIVERWQSRVPAGEPLMAWINAPFYLDFTRNPIFEIDTSGLNNPWARLPEATYMIWEYKGIATRSWSTLLNTAYTAPLYDRAIARKTVDFVKYLNRGTDEVIYEDKNALVFKLSRPFPETSDGFSISRIQATSE